MLHPAEMSEPEWQEFLTHLARAGNISASTQNQALSALLFLYKEVLKQEIAGSKCRARQEAGSVARRTDPR